MTRPMLLLRAAALACGLIYGPAQAVVPGQLDSFEDGSLHGWSNGPNNPAPPLWLASGGPAGDGDAFMRLSASGAGPGGKLVAISGPGWAGDYLAAGVTAITMDLKNFGATDLALRLLVEGEAGSLAWSSTAVLLGAGSDWSRATFALTAAGLGGNQPALALASARQIRLYHGQSAGFPGQDIVAQLGVDNIAAVPEPAAAWMSLAGLAALIVGRRRRAIARQHNPGGHQP